MKKNTIFAALALFVAFGYSQTEDNPLDVLFVGNSITYFNDLPQTFEAIAEEQGYEIELDQHTPGGTGFVHHVNNATLYQKFRDREWDYVVLQPGSNESPGFSYPIAETIERGEQLRDSILKYSPCASIYYYQISYGIVDDSEASFDQYLERSELIKNNITLMSNETDIPFAPVGECFKTSMQTDDSEFLWGGYGDIHPNAKGSFMGACAFYNALFKKEISNSNVNGGLTNEQADYFRNIAQDVTLNNLDDWNISSLTATALFDFEVLNDGSVNFMNQSTNYDTIVWDFGDGETSLDANPNHTFDFGQAASYKVLLTASKDCKEHHHLVTLTPNLLGVDELTEVDEGLKAYPNPVMDFITFSFASNKGYALQVFNLLGAKVLEMDIENNQRVNVGNLQRGVYLFHFRYEDKKEVLVRRVVVQ